MVCAHLAELEKDLLAAWIPVTYRGQAWGDSCREWVYFDCVLDVERLKVEYRLPEFVKHHENLDPRSGTESGLVCERCKDAIMGYLSTENPSKRIFPIY